MKLKIGLDLDGVIIDHTNNKIRLAKKYGYFLKPAQTSSESLKKLLPAKIKSFIDYGIYGKIGLSSKPMEGARETLKKITKAFSVPYVISRRYKKQIAIQWLKKNNFFPPLPRNQILFVKSDLKKNNPCKKLGIDVYLDDKIKVLDNLTSVKYRVLFDPYGHHYKNPPKNIKVVKTWEEFYKYLSRIKPS